MIEGATMTGRTTNTRRFRLLAVLLALALLAAACGGGGDSGGDGSTTSGENGGDGGGDGTVELNALFFQEFGDGTYGGGANPVRIRVNDVEGEEFRVGFTEDEVAGTGDQWRAAGWEAATVSTIITGGQITGREVTYDVKGKIDGPSAGGALTVGTIAAFRGDELNPNVVMTGTINPDGTIGPVGGIPQKVDGAVAVSEGKASSIGADPDETTDETTEDTSDEESLGVIDAAVRTGGDSDSGGDSSGDVTMLIPAGQGTSVDLATGENVDVIDLGRRSGIEVKEVADVYEAYEEFTGETLPRFEETDDTDLDAETNDRVEATVQKWIGRYQESINAVGALTPEGQQFALDSGFVDQADEAAVTAQDLSDQGLQAGAYSSALEAAALSAAALAVGTGWELGPDEWQADLDSRSAVCTEVDALVDSLGTVSPETVSDASGLIAAYTNAVDALSLCFIGDDLLTRPVETSEEALRDLLLAAVYFEFNDVLVESADDQLEFSRGLGGEAIDEDVDLTAIADFFRRAAEANLNAFDTVVIGEEAAAAGVNADAVRAAFAENFVDYALATSGLNLIGGLDEYFTDADTSAYAKLGGALRVYTLSSSLLAQFYSLGAQLDEGLNVVGVDNERALISALDLAEEQLAGAVTSLRAGDVEPVAAVGSYESGRVDREGDVSDKFGSLSTLWAGYVDGRMLAYIGGSETAGLG